MNEIKLAIPEYENGEGLRLNWADDAAVEVRIEGKEVLLFADKQGLISLANLLLNLSQDEVPPGQHVHLTHHTELENGSNDLIVGKARP